MREAIDRAEGFEALVVLGAEVDLRRDPPGVVRVPFESTGDRPVGVALRVSTFPGRFQDSPEALAAVVGAARRLVREARSRGIEPFEVQIDYDCPESKLADYAFLVRRLQQEIEVPLVITALPAWLAQKRAFGDLLEAADGAVLQVHSLAPPSGPGEEIVLCDPEAARAAVEAAARYGRPFRVALPTYGYVVAFDRAGKLVGLSAEGPALTWPAGATLRTARADPAAMAELVAGWTRDRPPELSGILWYRLPVAGDRLNWAWPTLRAVMAGRVPRPELAAEVREPEAGLVEIDLMNPGEAAAPWPGSLRIAWKEDNLLAADGLAGFRALRTGPREIRLDRSASSRALAPGERRVVAWLRFTSRTEVQIEIVQPAAP